MSEHYYSRQPGVKSEPTTWQETLRQKTFSFTSDRGVFSRKGIDFGSRLLIESFLEPSVSGPFADVGCGYGPIGLTIASEWSDRNVYMLDVNERAVALSKKNAARNHISNVTVLQSDLLEAVSNTRFAAILSNPPIRAGKTLVHQLLEDAYVQLVQHGELWIVIQKKQGAPSAKKKLESLFGNVVTVAKKKGYYIFKARKD